MIRHSVKQLQEPVWLRVTGGDKKNQPKPISVISHIKYRMDFTYHEIQFNLI